MEWAGEHRGRHRAAPPIAALMLVAVAACNGSSSPPPSSASSATASVAPTGAAAAVSGAFGLPFAPGTSVQIGTFALHAGNFGSVDGGADLAPGATSNGIVRFDGATTVMASMDLMVEAGTVVHPVAAGTILAAWPLCDVVVVDHGGGAWSEYIHLEVTVATGQQVAPNDSLGTVLAQRPAVWTPPLTCGNLENGPPHLHFSFASGGGAPGTYQGTYVPMAGMNLCGHLVDELGDLSGLGTVGGSAFSVPDCGSAVAAASPEVSLGPQASEPGSAQLSSSSPSPTRRASVTPTPKPTRSATPRPTATPTPTPLPLPMDLTVTWSPWGPCPPADWEGSPTGPGDQCRTGTLGWRGPAGVAGYDLMGYDSDGSNCPASGPTIVHGIASLPATATSYQVVEDQAIGPACFLIDSVLPDRQEVGDAYFPFSGW